MSLCYASVFQSENLVDAYICIRRVKPVLFLTKTIAGLQQQYEGSLMGTGVQRELWANHGPSRALWAAQRPSEGWDCPAPQSFSPRSRTENLCQIPWRSAGSPVRKQQPASRARATSLCPRTTLHACFAMPSLTFCQCCTCSYVTYSLTRLLLCYKTRLKN